MRTHLMVLSFLALLAGCGGGGGDAAGGALNVNPIDRLFGACDGVVSGVLPSKHVVRGGQPPYKVSSLSPYLVLGDLVSGEFVRATSGQYENASPLIFKESNSIFYIDPTGLPCGGSKQLVELVDAYGASVSVSVSTEGTAAVAE